MTALTFAVLAAANAFAVGLHVCDGDWEWVISGTIVTALMLAMVAAR